MADAEPGETTLTVVTDGPYLLTGPAEIRDTSGRLVRRTSTVALCRCGGSGSKPYCDGGACGIGGPEAVERLTGGGAAS